jgi:hypothetical protein
MILFAVLLIWTCLPDMSVKLIGEAETLWKYISPATDPIVEMANIAMIVAA